MRMDMINTMAEIRGTDGIEMLGVGPATGLVMGEGYL